MHARLENFHPIDQAVFSIGELGKAGHRGSARIEFANMRIVTWFSLFAMVAALASLLSGHDRILFPLIACVAALYYLYYRRRWGASR